VSTAGSEQSPQNPAYDLDEDGQITVNDSVELALRYTNPGGALYATPQPEGSR
jgi:hypothetical protein